MARKTYQASTEDINRLKQVTETLLGFKILTTKDCQILIEKVRNSTYNSLGLNTIRRLYGIIESNTHPSQTTLDVLSAFNGYKNFSDFSRSLAQPFYWQNVDSSLVFQIQLLQSNQPLRFEELVALCEKVGDHPKMYDIVAMACRQPDKSLAEEIMFRIFELEVLFKNKDYSHAGVFDLMHRVGDLLREHPERNRFYEHYAPQEYAQNVFFELYVDIDYLVLHHHDAMRAYLKYKKTPEAIIFGNSLLSLYHFLKCDFANAKPYIDAINSIKTTNKIHPYPLGRKMAYNMLYEFNVYGKVSQSLIDETLAFEKSIPRVGLLQRDIPVFQNVVTDALNECKLYEECIKMCESVTASYTICKTTGHLELARFWVNYALALVKTGNLAHASKCLSYIDPRKFYSFPNAKYNLIGYYQAQAAYSEKMGDFISQKNYLSQAYSLAASQKFRYYEEKIAKILKPISLFNTSFTALDSKS